MNTKKMTINGEKVTRVLGHAEYYQVTSGLYYLRNPQTGWVEVPAKSRRLRDLLGLPF